jgi:hypothetical protein
MTIPRCVSGVFGLACSNSACSEAKQALDDRGGQMERRLSDWPRGRARILACPQFDDGNPYQQFQL